MYMLWSALEMVDQSFFGNITTHQICWASKAWTFYTMMRLYFQIPTVSKVIITISLVWYDQNLSKLKKYFNKNIMKTNYANMYFIKHMLFICMSKWKFETKRILFTTNNIFQPNSPQFKLFITIKLNKIKHQNKLLLFSIIGKQWLVYMLYWSHPSFIIVTILVLQVAYLLISPSVLVYLYYRDHVA